MSDVSQKSSYEKETVSAGQTSELQKWLLTSENKFEVGGEDLLEPLRKEFPIEPPDEDMRNRFQKKWDEFIKECRIRFGTILKSDTLSILLGAGSSKHAGGVLLSSIPASIERELLQKGIHNGSVDQWLELFYAATHLVADDKDSVPTAHAVILDRFKALSEGKSLPSLRVNLEKLLSLFFRWQKALFEGSEKMRIEGDQTVDLRKEDLTNAIRHTKKALIARCLLPNHDAIEKDALRAHRKFLKQLLTRPLNLKRVNLYTLNYDTLVEQAADAESIVLLDGFIGTLRRVFRPESYDQDLYFPAETTEGRVHRLDRVAHLYKLHGSVTWHANEPGWDNPYGIISVTSNAEEQDESVLIYPTPSKYSDVLGMPYAEIFRRFAASVIRHQSVLFVIGYGFGDEHVVSIIRQALTVPSFRLIIIDLSPQNSFVNQLRQQKDQRVWIISGPLIGTFTGFIDNLLPDLREEEIEKKVMSTYKALSRQEKVSESADDEATHG